MNGEITNQPSTTDRRTMIWMRLLFAVWLVSTGIGAAYPAWRLWGFHLPAFLPMWAQIVFFGTALVFLFMPLRLYQKVISALPRMLRGIVHSPLAVLVLLAGFIVFRSSTALLGDGALRGREAHLGIPHPAEILPGYLASWVYDLVHPMMAFSGQHALAVLSIAAGCGFLLLIWHFPRRIWENTSDRLTARVFLTLSGVTVLFFGYIEVYALPCVGIVGFLLAAESYRRGKERYYVCLLFFVLALVCHPSALALFPALVALALMRRERRGWRLLPVGLIGAAAAGWILWIYRTSVFAVEAPIGSLLVPLIPQPLLPYSLFSPAHLLDIVNLSWLVIPGVLIAMPLLLRDRTPGSAACARAFWLAAIIIPLSIPLLLDPKLGMARDWDLLSLGLIPLLVWAAVRLADTRSSRPRGVLALPVFAATTVLVMFAGINAHTTTAIARFEKILDLDPARGGYGHEILATLYRKLHYTHGEIRHLHLALQLEENKRYWTHLAAAYLDIGDRENALQSARNAYAIDTSFAPGVYYLGAAFDALEIYDSALWCYSQSVRLEPGHHPSRHDLAMALLRSNKINDALRQINIAIKLAPDSARYLGALGWILLDAGHFKEAEPILRRAIRMDPRCIPTLVNMIRLYHQTGRHKQALLELTQLKKRPDLPGELRAHLPDLEEDIRKALFPSDSSG